MAITIITGVPGTGKTAFLVSELEKIAATGRKIFVDNIPGLLVPHYRAGKISEWQKGSWLHIDQYKRTSNVHVIGPGDIDKNLFPDEEETEGNENWLPQIDVLKLDDGTYRRIIFDAVGQRQLIPYESHKGALLVIDECQRHFRPRPAGSVVPDHVAALEVHRHQGLDIWFITQRPGLVDSNVRALCGRHIALRKTPFGRYRYDWPEVGDIDNKVSRDVASKSRFKLPKHVFSLYKSAEVHTDTKLRLPMVAKVLIFCLPLLAYLAWTSYKTISNKVSPPAHIEKKDTSIKNLSFNKETQKPISGLPPGLIAAGFESYNPKTDIHHPFEGRTFSIAARLKSHDKDRYTFSISSPDNLPLYISEFDLHAAGYKILDRSDCSVKIVYNAVVFYAVCNSGFFPSPPSSPSNSDSVQLPEIPKPKRSYENVVLSNRTTQNNQLMD